MQDLEKIREIQELGWDPPPDQEEPEGENHGGGSWVPLFQAALCLLALAALLFLKYSDAPLYQTVADWYHQEAEGEIQLPTWGEEAPQPSPSPVPSVTPSPSPAPTPSLPETDASLQRV